MNPYLYILNHASLDHKVKPMISHSQYVVGQMAFNLLYVWLVFA